MQNPSLFQNAHFCNRLHTPTRHANIVAMRFSRHSINEIFAKICTSWEGVQANSFLCSFSGRQKPQKLAVIESPHYKSRMSFAIWALADTKGKTDVKVSKDVEVTVMHK